MLSRYELKKFALKHQKLLKIYRSTFGKLKTVVFFGMQKKTLQKDGFNIIQKVMDTLESEGAVCFAVGGTLLGIIRDKKLMENDKDIDFGIYFDEKFNENDLDRLMKGIGLKMYRSFYYKGRLEEITYSSGVLHIDFFRHTITESGIIKYMFAQRAQYEYPSKNHFTPYEQHRPFITGFEKIKVGNFNITVPSNYEEFLESIYSKEWKVPNPNWSHYRDEAGIREIRDDYGIMKS